MQTEKKNIYQKLTHLRSELSKSKVEKSGFNHYSKYKYFELADFLPTLMTLFAKYEICSQFILDGQTAILSIIDAEKPDDQINFTTPCADASGKGQLPIQALGSQHTYLKRYLYLNALEIAEHDAIDALPQNSKIENETASKQVSLATKGQIEIIEDLYTPEEIDKMLKRLNKPINQLTVKEASKMISVRKEEKQNG